MIKYGLHRINSDANDWAVMKKVIARTGLALIGLALIVAIIAAAVWFEKQKAGEGLRFIGVLVIPPLIGLPLAWCVLNAWD